MPKRYSDVAGMMGAITGDATFSGALSDHLRRRQVISELVALRAARGYSERQFAAKLGWTPSHLEAVEAMEDKDLDLATLAEYAGAIGVRVVVTLSENHPTSDHPTRHFEIGGEG